MDFLNTVLPGLLLVFALGAKLGMLIEARKHKKYLERESEDAIAAQLVAMQPELLTYNGAGLGEYLAKHPNAGWPGSY